MALPMRCGAIKMSPVSRALSEGLRDLGSGMTKPNPSRCMVSRPATRFLSVAAVGRAYRSESTGRSVPRATIFCSRESSSRRSSPCKPSSRTSCLNPAVRLGCRAICFRMVESESIEAVGYQPSAFSLTHRGHLQISSSITMYPRHRVAATPRVRDGSTRSVPRDSCYAQPSARAPPPAFLQRSCRPHVRFRFRAEVPAEKTRELRELRSADPPGVLAADPIPAHPA